MENLFKKNNFSNNPPLPVDEDALDCTFSDSMYDDNRYITHAFIEESYPDGTKMKRLVNDVELCMSTSSAVLAVVSEDYQQSLRQRLLTQPKSTPRDGRMTDDELADSVIPLGMEMDEKCAVLDSIVSSSEKHETMKESDNESDNGSSSTDTTDSSVSS